VGTERDRERIHSHKCGVLVVNVKIIGTWFMYGMIPFAIFTTCGAIITAISEIANMRAWSAVLSFIKILVGMAVVLGLIVGIGAIIDGLLRFADKKN